MSAPFPAANYQQGAVRNDTAEWKAVHGQHVPSGRTPAGAAQREIVAALENALDARRQRILVSRSEVNWVKWTALIIQAICTLTAIAMGPH